MHKKKFHWWYIIIIAILSLGSFIEFLRCRNRALIQQAKKFRSVLPLSIKQSYNFSAYAGFVLPKYVKKWSLGGTNRNYSSLPKLMEFADGTTVSNAVEDLKKRREEMLKLLGKYVYGPIPFDGFTTGFEVLEEGTALGSTAKRKQVQITVTTAKGSMPINLLLYTPVHAAPAPVILSVAAGNYTVLSDPNILPDASGLSDVPDWEEKRGSSESVYKIEQAIGKGYGYAVVSVNDIAPDSKETYATRLVSLFDEAEFKALSAWAFGMSRAIDYLVTDESVDAGKIAAFGHSRTGKAALWAGANDERISLVLCNASGGGGAALNRANHADNISSLTKMAPHWFCTNYASYADHPDDLPVDSHYTIACVAPRMVYIGNGDNDLWADPQGSLNGLLYARPMFEAYGLDVIPKNYQPNKTSLGTGEHVWSASMAAHLRKGFHDANDEDWVNYFNYMSEYTDKF